MPDRHRCDHLFSVIPDFRYGGPRSTEEGDVQRGIDWNAIAMGLPIGIAIGIAMDEWVMGIPIGIAFGIAFAGTRTGRSAGEDGGAEDRNHS
jgi:hypothetical protein